MYHLTILLTSIIYIFGIVLASGFWQTFFTIFFPPYSLYLAVEYLANFASII